VIDALWFVVLFVIPVSIVAGADRLFRRRRARAMLDAEREADAEAREQRAKRKAPAKPVVSPYRRPQKNDAHDAPPLPPPPPEDAVDIVRRLRQREEATAVKPTYREPAKRTYHEEPRFVCCRCGARYVQRFDPAEIDLYEHCPACKQKAVHQT